MGFLIDSLGCIGFSKPMHCLVVLTAVFVNILVRGIRTARNFVVAGGVSAAADIPLRPPCSYVVLVVLHCLAGCYLANQLSLLRRQHSLAKSICLVYFGAALLIFLSGLLVLLPIAGEDDVFTVLAESTCFFILVSDFIKPLRIVHVSLTDRSALSFTFISILRENFFDLLMQLLIISLGVMFRLSAVLRACTYAALGLTSLFLSFYLVVPSALSIALSLDEKFKRVLPKVVARNDNKDDNCKCVANGSINSQKAAAKFVDVNEDVNPLARRVKFIMSAAILLVHAHSKLKPSSSAIFQTSTAERSENMSLDGFARAVPGKVQPPKRGDEWTELDEVAAADWGLTLVLAVVICLRFLLFSDSPSQDITELAESDEQPVFEQNQRPTDLMVKSPSNEYFTIEKSASASKVKFQASRKRLISDATLLAKTDDEIVEYFISNDLPLYALEGKLMSDTQQTKEAGAHRAITIRREILARRHPEVSEAMTGIPYDHYDEFAKVVGACCENVIGTIPLPVGLAGPLLVDGTEYMLPMATTEGCLVASVNRGCKVLTASGGVRTVILNDGMTRAPVVRLPDVTQAAELRSWLKDPQNFERIEQVFNGTSRFCRLSGIEPFQAGAYLYIRFVAKTGDAMGMNMVSRACETALSFIIGEFPACRLLSLSGNACADKKAAAVNWLMGRGKSVISEAVIPRDLLVNTLRTTPEALVRLNTAKNLIGSAMAGAIAGGFNAHSANILTALYIATGQDVAQVVESSACLTILEVTGGTPTTSVSEEPQGGDLHITCTLPTLEVGTVGGGTILGPQRSCLEILGVAGSSVDHSSEAGTNARRLAQIAAAAVLAGELSLLAALATNQLMPAHLRLNRSQLNMCKES